jgi:acid phosphatase (class A)
MPFRLLLAVSAMSILAACQTSPTPPVPPTTVAAVGELRPGSGIARGYVDRKLLPDSLGLLPRPPADGSTAAALDLQVHQATRTLRGSARWDWAARDAVYRFPGAADTFACVLGLPVSERATPHLNMLLSRTLIDAGLSTYGAKDNYKRARPFVLLNEPTCYPSDEASLRNDGSYPSGHAALGWAWGLVLAELVPDRADALLARAHAYGQSRVVCGYHWQSDVDAGRLMGAAAVARLHADATFKAQLDLARGEIASARAAGAKAPAHCAGEAAALGL